MPSQQSYTEVKIAKSTHFHITHRLPGTSSKHSHMKSTTKGLYNSKNTWKCFVRPGVADTGIFFTSNKVFIVELLPTFG